MLAVAWIVAMMRRAAIAPAMGVRPRILERYVHVCMQSWRASVLPLSIMIRTKGLRYRESQACQCATSHFLFAVCAAHNLDSGRASAIFCAYSAQHTAYNHITTTFTLRSTLAAIVRAVCLFSFWEHVCVYRLCMMGGRADKTATPDSFYTTAGTSRHSK